MWEKIKQNLPEAQPDNWKHTGKLLVTSSYLGVVAAFTTGKDHINSSTTQAI